MSNMNSALSTWQLVIMAVVPLMALVGWIATIFIVAREPRHPEAAAPAVSAAPAVPVASAHVATVRVSETGSEARDPVAA
jgi:hypothetical protein